MVKEKLQQYLEGEGIQTRNYFAGNLLLHPAYQHLGDAKDYPNAYEVLQKVFFLGTSPTLNQENLEHINSVLMYFNVTSPIKCDGYSCVFDL